MSIPGSVSLNVKFVVDRFVRLGADEIDVEIRTVRLTQKSFMSVFEIKDLYPEVTFVGHFHDTSKH